MTTPDDPALLKLAQWPQDRPAVLLHSGRFHPRWATTSLIASPRAWYRFTPENGSEWLPALSSNRKSEIGNRKFTHHLWHDLRELLNDPDLPGRWFGYFSYDLCRLIEPGKLGPRETEWPLVELAWCPEVEEVQSTKFEVQSAAFPSRESQISDLKSDFTRPEYESAVRKVIAYIAAGDVFQVNLAQRFTTEFAGNPRELFQKLAAVSPAWYGAYLELPQSRAILSTSPELFLELKNNHVVTRPIKGTRPATENEKRGHSGLIKQNVPFNKWGHSTFLELLQSEKDIAELNMIVDLMRNDLGRVCSYGSVRVTDPRTIESHPTVHHGTATVEGELHPGKDVVDLLRATLPGGSVTGAPKVRAMQVIDELEPVSRGPYCGAIGWITKDELQLSVAIRTMMLEGSKVHFSVGGGIVADSDPAAEYEETLTKAQAMLRALAVR